MSLPLPSRSNGQTIDQTWFNLVNDELVTTAGRVDKIVDGQVFDFFISGYYAAGGPLTQIYLTKLGQDITILAALLRIVTAGSSGNTEIDVLFKRGAGSWTSVFTTKPKLPSSAGDGADSDTGTGATAAVVNTLYQDLQADDLLRIDITSVQGGVPEAFLLNLYYQLTGT